MAEDAGIPKPLSPVEKLKADSSYLRGQVVEELTSAADHVSKDSYNLLKFHGAYQQDDRDARKRRDKSSVGKHYVFMVRCKIPGGKLSAAAYLAMDAIADRHANGTLRFTTRQGIQFHGVVKGDLAATIKAINEGLLTTLGACGDVERNVACCPAPFHDGPHAEAQALADAIAEHLAPRTSAYFEMWLNGQRVEAERQPGAPDHEPVYGKTYLPRKFKTGIALPGDNCIDVYAQDLGLVAIVEGARIAGYNVLVGGGMGMTPANPDTAPFLAKPIAYVPAADVLRAVEAVVKLYRDHGNRTDRKRARIKYLVAGWGVPRFKQKLEEYFGASMAEPRTVTSGEWDTHHGWQPQGDGRWFYGLSIENGRVKDDKGVHLRTALRRLVTEFQPGLRLTAMQDVLLCDLPAVARPVIERTLRTHGVPRPEQLSHVRRLSMACPAIPTCGLAISESERALPGIIDQLERELASLGLAEDRLSVRMTGCPNGCARPYQSDIGIVGRSGDKYTVYVGGRLRGDRLNFILQDLVPRAEIIPTLAPILRVFKTHRQPGESFGEFCARYGVENLRLFQGANI